jgi:hypothetical protein
MCPCVTTSNMRRDMKQPSNIGRPRVDQLGCRDADILVLDVETLASSCWTSRHWGWPCGRTRRAVGTWGAGLGGLPSFVNSFVEWRCSAPNHRPLTGVVLGQRRAAVAVLVQLRHLLRGAPGRAHHLCVQGRRQRWGERGWSPSYRQCHHGSPTEAP